MTKVKDNSIKEEALVKYDINKLRSNCMKLFNINTSTFDGATYGFTGEYSVKEVKDAIEKWLKKEAK